MENQDLSKKVLPYFYPTLSVTDASEICMGSYKLGTKKFTDYLSTRNEAFKSLIEMFEFNSGENIKEIMKKYPMSKEQKKIIS
jgi:Mor family transcriptional regulator